MPEIETEPPGLTHPHQFPRRILLAALGLSPQVVTETLYALAVKSEPRFIPTEIHLLATREGAERARITLLHPQVGWFRRFCEEYGIQGIDFREDYIHVVRDAQGAWLEDLRTPADNELLADELVELMRGFTTDDSTAVHVSIAGGRKTMGFYAGYVLSLFGRPQDRLSHVLVSPPFESNPDFYYPAPDSRIIYDRERRPLDARNAEVTLAEIPFVRLHHHLPDDLTRSRMRFFDAVSTLSRSLAAPELVLDISGCRVRLYNMEARLRPQQMAFLSWFAARRKQRLPPLPCPNDGSPEMAYAQEYLRHYQQARGPLADTGRTLKRLRKGMDNEFFMQAKSRLLSQLRRSRVPSINTLFHSPCEGGEGFSLNLPPTAIRYEKLGQTEVKAGSLA